MPALALAPALAVVLALVAALALPPVATAASAAACAGVFREHEAPLASAIAITQVTGVHFTFVTIPISL